MTRLFARHQVKNYAAWREIYDSIDANRKKMGVTADGVYRNTQDGNDVTVYHDFTSLEAAQAFTSSDLLRDAMTRAGVASEPQIWFVNEA